ncbi:MAG TPA: NUMOD3 domain-containing DNA-binding protein [Terriglobales bacterium]|nr:NUMOD3 domain-containing DNA-binding protein [Terriglobales bacterium]
MYPVYLITCFHPEYVQHLKPYVGCIVTAGKTVEDRFAEHLKGRRSGAAYLQRAIKKYGKEWFRVEQVDAGNTPEQALELEAWWVKRLGTLAPEGGYNLTAGGRGSRGRKASDETRQKMSDSLKGLTPWNKGKTGIYSAETRQKMSKSRIGKSSWNMGKAWNEEMKAKLSEAHKGYCPPPERVERMRIALTGRPKPDSWREKNKLRQRDEEGRYL